MNFRACFGCLRRRGDENLMTHDTTERHGGRRTTSHELEPVEVESANAFTYDELSIATSNFSSDNLLGRGGFGPVFRGTLARTGEAIAVKQLELSGIQGEREFLVEILILSVLRHTSLVRMLGYGAHGIQRFIVYELMHNGSLENHLFVTEPGRDPLDWETRMRIAASVARGLNYLHNSARPQVIHRDLKTSNILLDVNFNAKISDFGISKFGPQGENTFVSTRVMGTNGYCCPEYFKTGRLTAMSDIYSYGIVLLEIISGRRALDRAYGRPHEYILDWALDLIKGQRFSSLADPSLRDQCSPHTMRRVVELALRCLNENPKSRPTSTDVVNAMDFLVPHN